jgi:hypothetical protein
MMIRWLCGNDHKSLGGCPRITESHFDLIAYNEGHEEHEEIVSFPSCSSWLKKAFCFWTTPDLVFLDTLSFGRNLDGAFVAAPRDDDPGFTPQREALTCLENVVAESAWIGHPGGPFDAGYLAASSHLQNVQITFGEDNSRRWR